MGGRSCREIDHVRLLPDPYEAKLLEIPAQQGGDAEVMTQGMLAEPGTLERAIHMNREGFKSGRVRMDISQLGQDHASPRHEDTQHGCQHPSPLLSVEKGS